MTRNHEKLLVAALAGMIIAGRIAEIVTKRKFDQLIKQRLFNPMGMSKTSFSTTDGSGINPATGAKSTPLDFLKFMQMLLNNGKFNGKQILSEESVADFSKAIEIRPESAEALNYRGWAYYMLGDMDAAMTDLNHAIALDPTLHYAFNNRGLVWQAMGYPEIAKVDFEQAIELGMEENWAASNLYNVNFEIEKANQS